MTHPFISAAQTASLACWESDGGALQRPCEVPVAAPTLYPYTLCFFDRINFPVLREEFVAVDDSAAITHALTFCSTHLIEVLQGERVIARIPKGSQGMGPIERLDPQSPTERAL